MSSSARQSVAGGPVLRWGLTRLSVSVVALFMLTACSVLQQQGAERMQTDGAALSNAVADALHINSQTSLLLLTITNPSEGKVRLQGRVNSDSVSVAAEQVAANVDGVRSVINTLYVY